MAASEVQSKKRKGATDSQPKAKKARKSDDIAATKPTKPARKQAVDFFSDDEAPAPVEATKPKKSKKSKTAEPTNGNAVVADELNEKSKKNPKKEKQADEVEGRVAEDVAVGAEEQKPKKEKKPKKAKKTDVVEELVAEPAAEDVPVPTEEKNPKKGGKSKQEEPVTEVEEAPITEGGDQQNSVDEEDEALDDQTAALLAGFESDRDESDFEKEDEDFDEEALPEMGKEISKKKRKELEKARKDAEPGVIYLGRIPHGFFEPQMKKYFGQFGTVTRLRLSRNKKTGASKHYAFIEFANAEVAEIVAKTMHNYLMFGHILQCRIVPPEQVHPELFKGANERFKVNPLNQKEGAAMARGATRDVWEKRVKKENKRRAAKSKALLEEFGYEFNAPPVRSVDSVPKKTAAVEDGPAQPLLTQEEVDAEPDADTTAAAEAAPEKKSKNSKEKKRKSDAAAPDAIEEPEVAAPRSKKVKKESQGEAVVEKKRKVSQNGAGTKKAKKVKA